jgi:phosphocarrier protein HPr
METHSSQRVVVVLNRLGLHMRPADLLVRTASRFQSQIELEKDGQAVDCKSILGILTLAAQQGAELTLRATGSDAPEAIEVLADLFTQKFFENDTEVATPGQ